MKKYIFNKLEVQKIKEDALLSDLQERLLEYRIKGYSIVQMAMKEYCSQSKISSELKKLDIKIKRAM